MFINWILYLTTVVTSSLCEMVKQNSTKGSSPPCGDNKFIQALVHFRISSPEDLIYLAMLGDQPNLCRDLTLETERIGEYIKHCEATPDQGLYLRLLAGLATVKSKLCDDAPFRELYDKNKGCYNVLRFEVMPCAGTEDWIEIENSTNLCKVMKNVIGCHYTKALLDCDIFAAEVLLELMRNIMSSITDVQCKNIVQHSYFRDLRSILKGSGAKLMPEILSAAILIHIIL